MNSFLTLVLQADGEYGTHVYFRNYNTEISFYSDYEEVPKILTELEEKIRGEQKNGT